MSDRNGVKLQFKKIIVDDFNCLGYDNSYEQSTSTDRKTEQLISVPIASNSFPTDVSSDLRDSSSIDSDDFEECVSDFQSVSMNCEKLQDHIGKESEILEKRILQPMTRMRLHRLLEKNPHGILCSELPRLYKSVYLKNLEYLELGFKDVNQFIKSYPDIFAILTIPNVDQSIVLDSRKYNRMFRNNQSLVTRDEDNVKLLPDVPILDDYMSPDDSVRPILVSSLSDSDYIEVFVSEVFTPSFFWVQLQNNKKELVSMMKNIQKFYNGRKPDTCRIPLLSLKPGLNVACKYQGAWHRAIIEKILQDGFIMVFFYDYGTAKPYDPRELCFLHKQFSLLPAQAITCGLYNIKPINNCEWSEPPIDAFLDKVWEIPLVAKICHTNKENNTLLVSLIDINNIRIDVHVSDWLVKNHYAEYGKMINTKDNFLFYHYQFHLKKKSQSSSCTDSSKNEAVSSKSSGSLKLPKSR